MKYAKRWEMPKITFYEIEGHEFGTRPLYGYGKTGEMDNHGMPKTGEWFNSLEHAMVAWVAEKYTGPRGAGGTGVGTAADWFMKMIGADQLVPAGYAEGQQAMSSALTETSSTEWNRARAITAELERQGLVLARMNTP